MEKEPPPRMDRTDAAFTSEPAAFGQQPVSDEGRPIEVRTAVGLALVLSVSNLGCGVAAGLSGLPIIWVGIATATCSFVFMSAGFLGGVRGRHLAQERCSVREEHISLLSA